jgi:hypothetical protein
MGGGRRETRDWRLESGGEGKCFMCPVACGDEGIHRAYWDFYRRPHGETTNALFPPASSLPPPYRLITLSLSTTGIGRTRRIMERIATAS